jgi:hypothetical protein
MKSVERAIIAAHIRDCALQYHRLGLCPIPTQIGLIEDGKYVCSCGRPWCGRSAGKHPAVEWTRYQRSRPTLDQVRQWFDGRYCGFNVGTVHGAITGTVLLDWDGEEGRDTQRELEHRLGRLPASPTVLTGGGGQHQLYRHPACHVPTAAGLAHGFDVRADGGFSVLPPSTHATLRDYEWDVDYHIDDVPIAKLPPAWIEFIRQPAIGMKADHAVEWTPAPNGTQLVTDGRETFMRDVVWQTYHRLQLQLGKTPPVDELYAVAAANYAPYVDLKKPGRGLDQLHDKCSALLKRIASGKIIPKTELEKARDALAWIAARKRELYSR